MWNVQKKNEISRAKRAKQMFFKIEYVNLLRSYLRRGRGYLMMLNSHHCLVKNYQECTYLLFIYLVTSTQWKKKALNED